MSQKKAVEPAVASSPGGYFARRPVRPGELPVVMKRHIFTGTLGSAWSNLLTGIIYIYFGNAVGMTQLEWGILGGISAWVVVVQPLGAVIGERTGSRKMVWFWFALVDRVLRFLAIIGAYLLWREGYTGAYFVFMGGICIATLIGNFSPGPWYGWFATIIPQEVQGTFWGRRDSWISLVVICVLLPSGFLIDLIPEGSKVEAGAVILVAGSIIGFVDILVHGTIPEPPFAGDVARGSLGGILAPLKNKRFRPWLRFFACWNFSQNLGGSLCTLYFMENLGFKNNLLGGMFAITVVGLLGTLFAARRVGRMVDRIGVKRTLFVGHIFWCTIPGLWLFATPATAILWVGLGSLVGGIFSIAANNAAVKLATRFPSPEESGMYMAVSTMVGSFAGGLASIAAGEFLHVIGDWSFTVRGLAVSAFPLIFIISLVLRFVTVFTLLPGIRVKSAMPEDERPFLLPLFFEGVPAISRIVRLQLKARAALTRGRKNLPEPEADRLPDTKK
jgi:hypothetical protein